MTALAISNVVKRYGATETVCGVSLEVEAGQRVALLGHNGAGKTTLMKMVLGLTPVSAGSIEVLGSQPGSRTARTATGFLPENAAFHGALTGREQLHHFARLKSVALSAADDMLTRVGLAAAADRRIRTYSKGMRQRVGLAQALLGRPQIALLDEPTSGLDPVSRHEFYDIVDELAQSGTTVLISSHALTELETRCDRIAILSAGQLVADGDLAGLRKAARLPVRFNVTATMEMADSVAAHLQGKRVNGHSVALTCQENEKIELLGRIAALGQAITDFDVEPPSLEELYRHYSAIDRGGL
ncbi:MAG: ABC transporter ATP-binding protein [Alphaproteobacteria bacterium]|nr:ABC transporter ATP-binding protein [Alphaproteobacteria bacterium]